MSLVEKKYNVRLELVTTLLGSQPTDSIGLAWVRQQQIDKLARELKMTEGMTETAAKKAATERIEGAERTEAAAAKAAAVAAGDDSVVAEDDPLDSLRMTAFHRDERGLYLVDYQIKGFLKEAVKQLNIKVPGRTGVDRSARQAVASLLFVFAPTGSASERRKIHLLRDGKPITKPDGIAERPLRADTAQGPRTSIAVSQEIAPPAALHFEMHLLRGNPLKRDGIEDMLEYAAYQGLGQWRSGGFGRCEYHLEEIKS